MEEEPKVAESKYSRPARMAVVWSPAVLNTPGQKPTRGFGGRIYFYDGQNRAVPVEGQLVVYGYNDTKQSTENKTPDRKYAFTPEHFTAHYSPTDLGASYSVWVPWDEIGGEQIEVSLVPIFTAASGQLVVGQSSRNLLPGPTTLNTPLQFERHLLGQSTASGAEVQQVSHQQPAAEMRPRAASLEETTIRVPGTLAERMAQAPPQLPAPAGTNRPLTPIAANESLPPPALATAGWTRTPGVALPPPSPTNQPLARFVRSAPPAPSWPALPPGPGHLPTPQYPGAQPSALPASRPPGQ
jgi:hypothetical protein